MSAGTFVLARYAAAYNTANIHPIRVQPETLAAAIGAVTNAVPPGAVNNPISASASGSRKKLGLYARSIRMRLAGTVPTGYSTASIAVIPALTAAFFAAAVRGATCDYLGTTWTVISRTEERTG